MSTIITQALTQALANSGAPAPVTVVSEPIWIAMGSAADPRAALKGVWRLGDIALHVVALAVHLESCGTDRRWRQVLREARGDLRHCRLEFDAGVEGFEPAPLWQALGMAGECDTLKIEGRDYAVFAFPFCR